MSSFVFSLSFVAALGLSVAMRLWLARRQVVHVGRHRDRVPEAFADRIDLAAHQRAADYTVARVRFGTLELFAHSVLLITLTLLGALQWLYELASSALPGSPLGAQLLFLVMVALVQSALELPFDAYRQFGLEKRFGFSRMSVSLFITDMLRGTLIAVIIGLPLAMLVLWLMRASGDFWWLYVWMVWVAFNALLLLIYPTLIAPRFNRFEPLPDGPLRERVEGLLRRCGFRSQGLFVMDGSKRSNHGNAYFTGFGRAKRIVFFDTLISRLDADQIEAVLAHELGHFRHRHVLKRMLYSFVGSFLGLALLGWLSTQLWFYEGLGMQPGPIGHEAPALLLFMLAVPVFLFPLRPLASFLSRKDEFEADAFAAAQTDARHLVSALVRLYQDNAATLTPDPLHSAFYDSHPPAAIRVGRLLAAAA
ncbi:MAG: M48 family metallopeptidase [Burkholderiaceae bacterium]